MKLKETRNTNKYRKYKIGRFIIIFNDLFNLINYNLLTNANFQSFTKN